MVGVLGGVLGHLQVGGALLHRALEAGHVVGDLVVAVADLGEHAVEAGDQGPDLVVGASGHGPVVVVGPLHLLHGMGEGDDRAGDLPLHAPGEQQSDQAGAEAAEQAGEQAPAEPPGGALGVRKQHHPADPLVEVDDRRLHLDRAALEQPQQVEAAGAAS